MSDTATTMFVQEARDLLEGLEDMLLDLEADPRPEKVDAVFRALHTIKGSGAMFGFDDLSQFTHHFEDAFDKVREGRLAVDGRLVDLSLRARDLMRSLLEDAEGARTREAEARAVLIRATADLTGPGTQADRATSAQAAAPPKEATRFDIFFRPAPDDLINGMRPDLLIEEIGALGPISVALDLGRVPPLDDLDPTRCWLGWHMSLTTSQGEDALRDVFIFADEAELTITPHTAMAAPEPDSPAPDDPAPARDAAVTRGGGSIRVESQRLDDMMDRLGELVIVQARLDQISRRIGDPMLETVVEEIDRLVTGLRDTTLSTRMLPIEMVFGKFRRVVRDLSGELEKTVALVTEGGETEIDKSVIDKLSEPLVHMIRNAIDHGIDDAETRRKAGKPAGGTVRLSATQEGGEVLITIADDGRGLDADAIRARAVERGLIEEAAVLSEAELHQLIFAPGFSTAKELTSISGRGVGMDAVKTTVDALRGQIQVASTAGRGTAITLRLPVSLAIIDGLLVRLGDAVYVIPLSSVEECVELDLAERHRESGRTMLQIRETLVPFLDLADIFNQPASTEPRRRVVIVRADGARLGLVVDDILGQNQTVIKTLSVFHRDVAGFAGATILGDGAVALILDVAVMIRTALEARDTPSVRLRRQAR
ncbi:chemotaxis protein CheA [Jannaschia formosa]|uniref:chemotaxis protein CheA n=1 Tax=Jannaschia formosa TaxID=2259592 RepID=UPI000E1B7873|nr:chemotaxis protein CheA [Jannaschia formosa]TFL17926.1 chemotaxis protein CheA [Jannaschia formosa]